MADASMIGSLGDALAGVNISGSTSASSAGAGTANANASGRAATAATTATTAVTNPFQTTPSSTPRQSSAGEKEGLDLFLSRSPSLMLGNDVFKQLNSGVTGDPTTGLPGLSISDDAVGTGGGAVPPTISAAHSSSFDQQTVAMTPRQQRTSPSSNITGTTTSSTVTRSSSSSPYESAVAGVVGAPTGHTIPAFSNPGGHGSIGTPSVNNVLYSVSAPVPGIVQSPAATYPSTTPVTQQGQQFFSQQQQQHHHHHEQQIQQQPQVFSQALPPQQQQQQMLYMMVPTPDGRGQVLQPFQMIQMPNKTYAYVMPGMNPDIAAQMTPPPPQPMMVMMPPPGAGGGPTQVVPQMIHQQQVSLPQSVSQAQQPIGVGGQTLLVGGSGSGNMVITDIGGRKVNPNEGLGATYGSAALGGPSTDDYGSTMRLGLDTAGGIDLSQYMTPGSDGGDPTMSSLYASPQRPPLETLLGQIRRLSRDQVGCRMVQQALDVEGPMAATLILQEGLPFWGEAMIDPFGNYLFQKILEKITPEERVVLVKSVSTRLVNASLNLHGTRSVQKIVEMCAMDDEEAKRRALSSDQRTDSGAGGGEETASDVLTSAISPAAARLCIDSHGNHVIQRILLKLDPRHSQFVFDAVAESVGDVARHRHGCCVIQRCLDSPTGSARSNLVRRIVDKSLELMQDAYGNYVVQYVLDVCSDEDVHAVCESVVGKVNLLAIQKFSSNVMEKCLERCTDRVKELYLQELSDSERIRELMMDPFGNYVIQRALTVATHAQAIRLVEAMRPHLIAQAPGTPNGQRNGGVRNTAGGRRIMAKICRRFPNFNLNSGEMTEELYSQNRTRHHQHNQHGAQMAVPHVYGIGTVTPQLATNFAPHMSQVAPGPIQQPQQQQPIQQTQELQQQQTLYATNPPPADFSAANTLAMNGFQFDQQRGGQPFYSGGNDFNNAFFQQTPQMGHNSGAYQGGL